VPTVTYLPATRRALTESEQRLVRAKVRHYAARAHRTSRSAVLTGAVTTILLWLLTMWASDAPWTVVTAFWVVAGGAITIWTWRELRGGGQQARSIVNALESALRRNTADVFDVRATSFGDFEEIEDEGACYAFDLGDGQVVFVMGQEFHASARFPSLDFSLVYALDESGRTADMFIDKRGAVAVAAERVPAHIKKRLVLPDHLEVRRGSLASVLRGLEPSETADAS
jgi:hypothetical protein